MPQNLLLAVIGCGTMGSAVLGILLDSVARASTSEHGHAPFSRFIASVHSQSSAEKLKSTFSEHLDRLEICSNDNLKGCKAADVVLMGCKPYMAESVLSSPRIREALSGKLLISIMGGLSSAQIAGMIKGDQDEQDSQPCTVICAMPGMAAQVAESMTLIAESSSPPAKKYSDLVEWMFTQVGRVKYVPEHLYRPCAILAASSPAMFTVAFDGFLDGAVAIGVKRDDAKELLAQAMLGTAKLLLSGEHPAVLREKVCSPKGSSIQGVLSLEKASARAAFSQAYMEAVNSLPGGKRS